METEIKINFKLIFYVWTYANAAIFISNKVLDNLYSPLTESHGRQVFLGLPRLTGGDTCHAVILRYYDASQPLSELILDHHLLHIVY